jgi:hypothetical protein
MSPAEKEARQEQADRKMRAAAEKAYNKEMPEADTTFGKLSSGKKDKNPEPTKARKIVEEMELERTYPRASKMAKETPTMAKSATDALKGGLGIPLAMGVDMMTGPKRRSEEDMSELTREVARGNKMAKGGMTASKRGDGIAIKGKTKGTMIAMRNGGKC